MALKLSLERITDDAINKAKEEAASFREYQGPTPPPDVYHVKATRLWATKTKTGKDMLKVLYVIKETGDKATYNGAPIFDNMLIPVDPSEKGFSVQMANLDSFFVNCSKGKFDVNDFVKAAVAGKIITGKKEKAGEPITSIGKFKFTGEHELDVKTELSKYGNNENAAVRFIVDGKFDSAEEEEDLDDAEEFDLDFRW